MKDNVLALLLAFISASRIIWFMPGLGNKYYLLLAAVLLFLLLKTRMSQVKFSSVVALLYVACVFSIFFNDIPSFFSPWMRFALFVMVTMLVGPFLQCPVLRSFRKYFFWYTLLFYVIIALISFIGRFVGISNVQGYYWCGITNHSMLMGIVAGNAGVFLLLLMTSLEGLTSKQRWITGGILLLCFLMMVGTASRSCIIAFVASGVVAIFVSMKQHRVRIVKIAVVAAIIVSVIFPLLSQYSKGIRQKNRGDVITLNISSRASLWERSWQTFRENPFCGIGFSAMEIDTGENIVNDSRNGQIEPGSSWLAVLSMTGLFGGFAILLVLNKARQQLKQIYKNDIHIAATLYGLLVFYCVHMCAEGYIFAGGSMSCLNFWLLLGVIDAYANDSSTLQKTQKMYSSLIGLSFLLPNMTSWHSKMQGKGIS